MTVYSIARLLKLRKRQIIKSMKMYVKRNRHLPHDLWLRPNLEYLEYLGRDIA